MLVFCLFIASFSHYIPFSLLYFNLFYVFCLSLFCALLYCYLYLHGCFCTVFIDSSSFIILCLFLFILFFLGVCIVFLCFCYLSSVVLFCFRFCLFFSFLSNTVCPLVESKRQALSGDSVNQSRHHFLTCFSQVEKLLRPALECKMLFYAHLTPQIKLIDPSIECTSEQIPS